MNNPDANLENYLQKLIDIFGENKIKEWKVESIISAYQEETNKLVAKIDERKKIDQKLVEEIVQQELPKENLKNIYENLKENETILITSLSIMKEHVEYVKLKSKHQKDKGDEILNKLELEFEKHEQILMQKNPKYKILTEKNAEMKRIKFNIKKLTNDIRVIKCQIRLRMDISNKLFYSSCIKLAKCLLNRKKYIEGMLQMRKLENEERALTAELKDLTIKIEQRKQIDDHQSSDQPTPNTTFFDTLWSFFSTTGTNTKETYKPQCKPHTETNKILILDNQIISSEKTTREKPEETTSLRKEPSQNNQFAHRKETNCKLEDKINRFNMTIAKKFESQKKSTMVVERDEIYKVPTEVPIDSKESSTDNDVEVTKVQSPPIVATASKPNEENKTRITQDLYQLNIDSQDNSIMKVLSQELHKNAGNSVKIPVKNAEGKLKQDNLNEKSHLLSQEVHKIQFDLNDRSKNKPTKEYATIQMEYKIENCTGMEKPNAIPNTLKMDEKEQRLMEKSGTKFPFPLPFFKATSENNSFPAKINPFGINLPFFGKTGHSEAPDVEHSAKKRKVDVENQLENISVANKPPDGKVDDDHPLSKSRSSLYNFGNITRYPEAGDNSKLNNKKSATIQMENKIENCTGMEKPDATPNTSKMDEKEPKLMEKSGTKFPFSPPFFKTTSENNSFPAKTDPFGINLSLFGKTGLFEASNSAKKRKVDDEKQLENISVVEKLPGGKVDDEYLNNSTSSQYNFGSTTQFLETGDNNEFTSEFCMSPKYTGSDRSDPDCPLPDFTMGQITSSFNFKFN